MASKYKLDCEILNTTKIIDGIYKFKIKVTDQVEPFLRRPISIYNIDGEAVEFIFQVKGKGTEILSHKKVGDTINVLGPLGNGTFTVKEYKKVAIIGGGIGTYPLYELAKELKGKAETTMYMGFKIAKQKNQI